MSSIAAAAAVAVAGFFPTACVLDVGGWHGGFDATFAITLTPTEGAALLVSMDVFQGANALTLRDALLSAIRDGGWRCRTGPGASVIIEGTNNSPLSLIVWDCQLWQPNISVIRVLPKP